MKINFINSSYTRFYSKHRKEIDKAFNKCLSKGNLIMKSEVEKFEKNFAKFCDRKYCISTSSGTDALKLASKISLLNPINTYRYRLPDNMLDLKSDVALITYMNSVQIPVDKLRKIYRMIVEDACQAVGRVLYGDMSCFSFYPAKMLGGIGKGGALVTNNEEIYKKLKVIRDDKWNNIWLDEIYAAFLNVKLRYLPSLLKRRQKITDEYNKHFPQEIIFNKDCLQNYLVIVPKHDEFISFMKEKGIEVISDKSDFYEGNLENAVRIPIYSELTNKEVKYIIKNVQNYFKK